MNSMATAATMMPITRVTTLSPVRPSSRRSGEAPCNETQTATPKVEFNPRKTGTYYIVVYQRELSGSDTGGVAMAVVYK